MSPNLTPEQKARDTIDRKLIASGWVIQDMNTLNFSANSGIVAKEYQTDAGVADYLLFLNRQPIGVIEAKREEEGRHNTTIEKESSEYAN